VADKAIGERHVQLLEVLARLASGDPVGAANMHKAAQQIGLDSVGKQADREEFLALARDLEEAGFVKAGGTEHARSFGDIFVTEEGHKRAQGEA
jgi:hypothetical protein